MSPFATYSGGGPNHLGFTPEQEMRSREQARQRDQTAAQRLARLAELGQQAIGLLGELHLYWDSGASQEFHTGPDFSTRLGALLAEVRKLEAHDEPH